MKWKEEKRKKEMKKRRRRLIMKFNLAKLFHNYEDKKTNQKKKKTKTFERKQ